MRALCAMALLLAATGRASGEAASTVYFLTDPTPALDDAAIEEAVSIYSRDLHLFVVRRPGAPSTLTPESLAQVIALVRSSGARMAFWYQVRKDAPDGGDVVLYAATADRPPNALRVPDLAAPGLPRALALKVRAAITGAAEMEPNEPTPSVAVASPVSPPPATPPRAPPPPPAQLATPATVPTVPRRPRGLISAGYRITIPVDVNLLRQGIFVEGALPLGRRFEVSLTTELTTQPSALVRDQGEAHLFDVPFRLGARALVREGRLALALGPSLAVHILSVSAVGFDGQKPGSAILAVLGLGGEMMGRLELSDLIAVELRLLVETLVPDPRFYLHQQLAFDAGGALFSLGAGICFAIP